jgi:hypothetical protein
MKGFAKVAVAIVLLGLVAGGKKRAQRCASAVLAACTACVPMFAQAHATTAKQTSFCSILLRNSMYGL